MKKILITIPIIFLLFGYTFAQSFDARLIVNEEGYIEYQLRQTSGAVTPSSTAKIYEVTIEIAWLEDLNINDFVVICSDYEVETEPVGKDCGWAPGYCIHVLSN